MDLETLRQACEEQEQETAALERLLEPEPPKLPPGLMPEVRQRVEEFHRRFGRLRRVTRPLFEAGRGAMRLDLLPSAERADLAGDFTDVTDGENR